MQAAAGVEPTGCTCPRAAEAVSSGPPDTLVSLSFVAVENNAALIKCPRHNEAEATAMNLMPTNNKLLNSCGSRGADGYEIKEKTATKPAALAYC
jgi:hypothetical protein